MSPRKTEAEPNIYDDLGQACDELIEQSPGLSDHQLAVMVLARAMAKHDLEADDDACDYITPLIEDAVAVYRRSKQEGEAEENGSKP